MTRRISTCFITILLMFCASASVANASIQFVQNLGQAQVVSGFAFNIVPDAATNANDRLVLSLSTPGRQVLAVSDTQGNDWHVDTAATAEATVWSAQETTPLTTADHIHVQLSQGQTVAWRLDEYSGISATSPVDTKGSGKSGTGTSSAASLTTTYPDDLVISALRSTVAAGVTSPSDETQLSSSVPLYISANLDAPVGTYIGKWTWQASNYWAEAQVSYEAANDHEYVDNDPLYNAGSWVNSTLPSGVALDPNSASMAAKFSSQVGVNSTGHIIAGTSTGLRWNEYADVYVSTAPLKTVCSTEVLTNTSWPWMNQLHNAWMTFKVPVPLSVPNLDGGSDHAMTVYDPATDQMWDFYEWKGAAPAGTVDPQGHSCDYEAEGGDYQPGVSMHPGYFQNLDLGSGVTESNMWGRRAAALPSVAGAITPDEWNHPLAGFDHTLQLIVPCADTAKQYWPAERHDGCSSGAGGLPEGARVRIDPTVICPHGTAGSSGPTQLAYDRAYELCRTMQDYGAVVTDQTGRGGAFLFADPISGGKPFTRAPDGGNCCAANMPPGTGVQWFNWYWDASLSQVLPHLQVVSPSYRPPYAPLSR